MTKRIDRPNGVFISPELREVISRLRDREPELDEIVDEWPEPIDEDQAEGEGSDDDAEKG